MMPKKPHFGESRRPLVPRAAEIAAANLPRWAAVAFAGRCARRVFPLIFWDWDDDYFPSQLRRAVELIACAAATARRDLETICEVSKVVEQAEELSADDGTVHASSAISLALDAMEQATAAAARHSRLLYPYQDAVRQSAFALLSAAASDEPVREWLLCIRRDFDRIVSPANEQKWTDDTPVPQDVFGPMWPKNLTPEWAKEPPSAS